ncbi:MAG: DUF6776 family protein [Rubrivivax sp.]
MRWKLWRRRLSVSAPRMIVRSHLPWPLRWAVAAVVFGFSAAIALWAFEFGKDIAGLDRDAKAQVAQLEAEVQRLRAENERALAVAHSAESLLKTERTSQERLAQALRQLEEETRTLKADLGFFERLIPSSGPGLQVRGLQVRGLQAQAQAPGQLRYQMLVMHNARSAAEFAGRYEMLVSGTLAGRPWSMPAASGPQDMKLKQYLRIEGVIDHPPQAVIKSLQVRVLDEASAVKATQTVPL